ncbi:hypothetical protein G5B40_01395 [Pikeienuella piscinae]|uniref:Uncharacterized protein n=1 Tax=Pikeienuella piscinae TaxID=2748098 RepID=A0A7L5BSP0_9RHOB|nr:hypothetical protein [Pikeienuella piscinae]QIE54215.1 hypothetical protein G5B40_01395 [Pikeienuella piscinae]
MILTMRLQSNSGQFAQFFLDRHELEIARIVGVTPESGLQRMPVVSGRRTDQSLRRRS